MRHLSFILICFLAMHFSAGAQSLDVYNIDASGFPIMKAKFRAFDREGKLMSNFGSSDFKIIEDGVERVITNVTCPQPIQKPFEKVSVAMSIDISGSMGIIIENKTRLELAKITALNLAQLFFLPPNEIALQTCDDKSFINLDFTTKKERILDEITSISEGEYNNFVEHLLNPVTGILNVAKYGKNHRIALLYTDAWWSGLSPEDLQRCKDTCSKYGIRFYAAVYARPEAEITGIKKSLLELTKSTGGRLYDDIISVEDAITVAKQLKGSIETANTEPCEIEWIGKADCEPMQKSLIQLSAYNIQDLLTYWAPQSLSSLQATPQTIKFTQVNPGSFKDTIVSLVAMEHPISINSIIPTHPTIQIVSYGGAPPPFILQKNETRNLTLRFSPIDSSRIFATIDIKSDACLSPSIYVSGGFPGKQQAGQKLQITHPNGGEVFLVDSDTLITWKGISPIDTVKLDYSTDNGKVWNPITSKASGLAYPWKVPNTISDNCLIRVETFSEKADSNGNWARNAGGAYNDFAKSITHDADGNIYICGDFTSDPLYFGNGISLTKNVRTGEAFFVAKYDKNGNILWARGADGLYGEISHSAACDVYGNVIIGGFFNSPTLDFGKGIVLAAPDYGGTSFIAKYDKAGNILWAKRAGEGGKEAIHSVTSDTQGNIIVTGWFYNLDFGSGIALTGLGDRDGFIAKFDKMGNILWAKSVGGSNEDHITAASSDKENNIYISGIYNSNELAFTPDDKLTNLGDIDGFIAKYGPNGNFIWGKGIGDQNNTHINTIKCTNTGFAIGGMFLSTGLDLGNGIILRSKKNSGGILGTNTIDAFIAMYNENGSAQWAKSVGGTNTEGITSLIADAQDNLYACGIFYSQELDCGNEITLINTELPYTDGFIVKFNSIGFPQWGKKIGGGLHENATSIDYSNGNVFVCGDFNSDPLEVETPNTIKRYGESDIFVLNFMSNSPDQSDTSDAVFSIIKPLAASHNIDMGRVLVSASKDSLIQSFIENTGSWPIRIDSINIEGINASDFQLVSGIPPFTIPVGDKKAVEFRFRPSAIGPRSADLAVLTQADTLHQSIIGEGVKPVIQVASTLIDFGVMEVGSLKDTTVTAVLKNIGDVPLAITNTYMLGPDKEQFEIISGGGNFTLASGATQTMQLRFSPKYIGRTSGQIGFDYDGMPGGRPAVVQLFGQGIGGNVYVVDDSAYVGETRDIKLMLGKVKPASVAQTAATSFRATLAFKNSILTPAGAVLLKDVVFKKGADTDTLTVTQQWSAQTSELARIPFIATLGDRLTTDIELLEFDWLDDSGSKIDYDTELQSGVFTVLGICPEGGDRLFDAEGEAQMMLVMPNPVNTTAEVRFKTIEKGNTTITLTDVLGRQLELARGDYSSGEHSVEIPAGKLTQGIYFLTMQTPTQVFTQRVIVEK